MVLAASCGKGLAILTASLGFNHRMQAINNAMMPLANTIISQFIGRWFVSGLFEGTIGISLQRLTF
ncbi:hypothetical protein MOSL_1682 [Moraxella osloensis]|nr:hypothetical protein MOSL_1682 [Moraxella osloensis]